MCDSIEIENKKNSKYFSIDGRLLIIEQCKKDPFSKQYWISYLISLRCLIANK